MLFRHTLYLDDRVLPGDADGFIMRNRVNAQLSAA